MSHSSGEFPADQGAVIERAVRAGAACVPPVPTDFPTRTGPALPMHSSQWPPCTRDRFQPPQGARRSSRRCGGARRRRRSGRHRRRRVTQPGDRAPARLRCIDPGGDSPRRRVGWNRDAVAQRSRVAGADGETAEITPAGFPVAPYAATSTTITSRTGPTGRRTWTTSCCCADFTTGWCTKAVE